MEDLSRQVRDQPRITVGILDHKAEITGRLNGDFRIGGFGPVSGPFSARHEQGMIVLLDGFHREISRSPSICLTAEERDVSQPGVHSTFTLSNVTIGNRFHWERKEDQTFQGDLILCPREDNTIAAINQISLEDYLASVISSEMNAVAPVEFLKAHAILSRSWILAALDRKGETEKASPPSGERMEEEGEVIRWYEREDHDLFDVCADDHCQRYQGVTKILSQQADAAVHETRGKVIACQGKICDARYSKVCGGLSEEFPTAWEDRGVPYLRTVSDSPVHHQPIRTEEEASAWILSDPEAYCNTRDEALLEKILSGVDRETEDFFRWRVEYPRGELEEILRERSGLDFGTILEIVPLHRGPSGRISRLKIIGSKNTRIVGKELEIRRWLSRTHLYSSAFVVRADADRFIFLGAGWGHGVGLCQVGAAVMATRGFSAEQILKHYFRGVEIEKIY